jgi:chorismate dehydratase
MTEQQIQMGKISYINASPVYYGLDHGLLPDWLKMVADVPSILNRKIMTGQIKVSPISAAFYAMNHRDLLLLPDLSISCNGRVLSVLLASQYPIDELGGKRVMFSSESASAAALMKMIFHQRKIVPNFEVGDVKEFAGDSPSADAVLVIGDAALTRPWDQLFAYCIDLGGLWHEMTQLPFVFAVWVVRQSFAKKHPRRVKEIHRLLLASKDEGYRHINEVVTAGKTKLHLKESVVKEYFDLLHCDLDGQKIHAMKLFFDSLVDQKILDERADIRFFDQ